MGKTLEKPIAPLNNSGDVLLTCDFCGAIVTTVYRFGGKISWCCKSCFEDKKES